MRKLKLCFEYTIGACLYYLLPRKRVVLLVGTMRSGTTLLKALLGAAEDVSHLSELSSSYYASLPPFVAYYRLSRLCREPIVVLKAPREDGFIAPAGKLLACKRILLIRNPGGVVRSIIRASQTKESQAFFDGEWDAKRARTYWEKFYQGVINGPKENLITVRYEDLLQSPETVTKVLFNFIGSKKREGVDSYPPRDWEWGNDDAGERIRSLKVQRANREDKSELPDWLAVFHQMHGRRAFV